MIYQERRVASETVAGCTQLQRYLVVLGEQFWREMRDRMRQMREREEI